MLDIRVIGPLDGSGDESGLLTVETPGMRGFHMHGLGCC
jgi:hypothetical protein